jgi:hypothetical protein
MSGYPNVTEPAGLNQAAGNVTGGTSQTGDAFISDQDCKNSIIARVKAGEIFAEERTG